MREIPLSLVREKIKELFISANIELEDEVFEKLKNALSKEDKNSLSYEVLRILNENYKIANNKRIPLCQDTGIAIIFLKIGQDIHFSGGVLKDAVNKGVEEAYKQAYLRKSIVNDPLYMRKNTFTNTPSIIHCEIVPGDKLEIIALPKGGGAENTSRLIMGEPSWGEDEIIQFVIDTVKGAGGKACPPIIVGIGIGGSFDYVGLLAKKALTRPIGTHNSCEKYAHLEEKLLNAINNTGIGSGGLGGKITCFAVHIEIYPTHIASLPIAVNIQCNSHRIKRVII